MNRIQREKVARIEREIVELHRQFGRRFARAADPHRQREGLRG